MVQQIDRLEEDLGFRLLLRSNQGVRLTNQGKIFYDAVLEMQKIYKEAVAQIKIGETKDVRVLCGTYEYMEASFEEMLKDTGAKMQDLHTEYNLESMVQAKFQESLLVFHSHWENCYSHILKVLPSHIIAGSVGVVMRKGEEKRLEDLVNEIQKAV